MYTFGDTIYNPNGVPLPDPLVAHEMVHMMHQLSMSPEAWWNKYIEDQEYRYQQELLAHKAEFSLACQYTKDRNVHAKLLMATAARLVAPLYAYSGKKLLQAQKDLLA